jgi:hypothetical protein
MPSPAAIGMAVIANMSPGCGSRGMESRAPAIRPKAGAAIVSVRSSSPREPCTSPVKMKA